jgi:murein L,D-transpeptidase YcbB/YkuD
VPYSIATKEMLPKLRQNPNALGPNFELLASGQAINFSSVDFNQYNGSNFPYTIRQKPGEKNALGRVKFMFPNKHAVYLHDTPSRSLFHKDTRAFSHGCVRVYKPIALARKVLRDVPKWSPDRIEQTLASKKTTRVVLPAKIPVHIIYATAFRGEGGSIEFRPDIYGRDRKLYRALFGKPTS